MKAKLYDQIVTLVDFGQRLIKKETKGTIVECYEIPEGYAVDLAIPDNTSVTEYDYENVILYPKQFMIASSISQKLAV